MLCIFAYPLAGCGSPPGSIGGTVTGLKGGGLTLQNNGGDDLTIATNGPFTFFTQIPANGAYAVTVKQQPTLPTQTCVVMNGQGAVPPEGGGQGGVTSVLVNCTTDTFSVGGTVTGLTGSGLVLQNNDGDDLQVSSSGTFSFPGKVASGDTYRVTVKAQPSSPSQTCTVSDGIGGVVNGNINSITINCTTNLFTIGGTVSGLSGTGLVLTNNDSDDVTIKANGVFTFPTSIASGAPYAIKVKSQPNTPSQTCTLTNGTGQVGNGNVTDIGLSCTTNSYAIGGTVIGLSGTGLVLQNNGGDDRTITANGPFTFSKTLLSGAAYAVTVKTQPTGPSQTCNVSGGSGNVGGAAVSSININCSTNTFAIGGTVSGLAGTGLVLQNNGGDDLTISANGSFAFSKPVASGATYAVTVKSSPTNPWQTCTITNGSGTVGGSGVAVAVACTTNKYTLSGTVTGLSGKGLVLQNNGGDDLTLNASGAFTFATAIASGTTYAVTVKTNPTAPWQTCTVTNGGGTVAGANIATVAVNCVINKYRISGSIAGLAGTGLVLQNNGGDDLTIPAAATSFTFATTIASGGAYAVTIKTQPSSPSQTCSLSAATGAVAGSDVTSVVVNCQVNKFTVGGTVSGLAGTGLVLQNNGGGDLAIATNGAFTFTTPVNSGTAYSVTVKTQPSTPWQTCAVTNGSGTVGAANVTNITVTCTVNKYTVGGTVYGLTGAGLVLQNNGGNDLTVAGTGTINFTFSTPLNSLTAYNVTIKTQPAAQICSVSSASGTVTSANITSVRVDCVPIQCQRIGWKFGSASWACPTGLRLPTTSEIAKVTPCITASDTAYFSYYHDIAVSVGGCNCKWNGSWCGQPSIETIRGGRMCGDFDQLQICVQ